jgi:hypothetical protein
MSGHWQQLFNYVAGPMHPASMNGRWRTDIPLNPADVIRRINERAASEKQHAARGPERNAGVEFVKDIESQRAAAIAERKRSGKQPVTLGTNPTVPTDDFDPGLEKKIRTAAEGGDLRMANLVAALDAARNGDRDAQAAIGGLLWKSSPGIPMDRGRALVWLNRAAFNKQVPFINADEAPSPAPPPPPPPLPSPFIRPGRYFISISKTEAFQPGLASNDLTVTLAIDGTLTGTSQIGGGVVDILGPIGAGGGNWFGKVLGQVVGQGGGNRVSGTWAFDSHTNRLNLFVSGSIMGQAWSLQVNCVFDGTTPDGELVGYGVDLTQVRARRLGD